MSGPVVPPLEVTEVDGSPDGRPITKIIVSNGDLTISGREATIDTSGSATVPGTPATAIQFNSDPAGTFTGSERLVFETGSNNAQIFIKSGASATQTEIRAVDGWGLQLSATDTDNSIRNQIVLFGENDGPDGILLVPNTGENVRLQTGGLTTSASDGDLVLSTYDDEDKAKITLTAGAGGGVVIQTDAAGFLQLENTTTDTDSIFTVLGNGTGTPKVKLENGSMAVQTICEANKEFTIEGGNGGDTFVFDVSSATGGITWPDGTEQLTASGGGGGIGIVYPPVSNSQSSSQIHWGHISAPFGTSAATTQAFNTDSPCWIPIIARRTATFTDISIRVTTGVGSTSNIDLGVYSDDSGEPGTLLGQATVDVDTSGTKSATLAAEVGESLDSVAGTQYWLAMVRQAGVGSFTMQAGNKADVPQWAWTGYATSYGIIVQSGSDNTLPASATFTSGFAWEMVAIGVDYE